jgi:predicted MFS family arabinose efflux permease
VKEREAGGGPPLRRNRDFTILWCGLAVSDVGSSMSLLVFPLVGYAISGSAAQAGLASAAMLLGQVVAGLPAGALVDRWPRKRVLVAANVAGFAVFSSLATATLLHALTMPHLIVGGFAGGVVRSFLDPAASAAIRAVVPPEQLPLAYTRLQARHHAVGLTGPPLGGALFSVARGLPFLVDAVSYCLMALTVTRLRSALPAPANTATGSSFARELGEGLRFVWRDIGIRTLMIWGGIFNFAVTVVFVGVTLRLVRAGVHPAAIGAVDAIAATAGLLGAVLAPVLIPRIPTGALTIATTLVIAAVIAPMAWTQNVVLIGALLAAGMVLLPANNAGVSSYLAAVTPDGFQGRMNSAAGFLSNVASPAAPVVAGVLIGSAGGRVATLAGAVLVVLSVVPLLASRVVRSLGPPDTWIPVTSRSG